MKGAQVYKKKKDLERLSKQKQKQKEVQTYQKNSEQIIATEPGWLHSLQESAAAGRVEGKNSIQEVQKISQGYDLLEQNVKQSKFQVDFKELQRHKMKLDRLELMMFYFGMLSIISNIFQEEIA